MGRVLREVDRLKKCNPSTSVWMNEKQGTGRYPGWSFSSWAEEEDSALEEPVRYPSVDVR